MHAQVRKIIKTRGHFPTDEAATKLVWLALRNITARYAATSTAATGTDRSVGTACSEASREAEPKVIVAEGRIELAAPRAARRTDLSARTRHRWALLERWLAQFWNEAEV